MSKEVDMKIGDLLRGEVEFPQGKRFEHLQKRKKVMVNLLRMYYIHIQICTVLICV